MSGTNRSSESQHVLSSGNYACSPNTRSLFSKRSQYMPLQGYLFLVSKHLTYTSSLRDVTLLIQFSRTTSRKQFSLICAAKLSHSQQGAPRFFLICFVIVHKLQLKSDTKDYLSFITLFGKWLFIQCTKGGWAFNPAFRTAWEICHTTKRIWKKKKYICFCG